MQSVRLSVIYEVSIKNIRRQVLFIAVKDKRVWHTKFVKLFLYKKLTFFLAAHMDDEYRYVGHVCLSEVND